MERDVDGQHGPTGIDERRGFDAGPCVGLGFEGIEVWVMDFDCLYCCIGVIFVFLLSLCITGEVYMGGESALSSSSPGKPIKSARGVKGRLSYPCHSRVHLITRVQSILHSLTQYRLDSPLRSHHHARSMGSL